jgi:hypothetical protein
MHVTRAHNHRSPHGRAGTRLRDVIGALGVLDAESCLQSTFKSSPVTVRSGGPALQLGSIQR